MSSDESSLRSKDDFLRFCAELRGVTLELDDMVEALRALAGSTLPTRDKTRFARSIARALTESFHAAEVRAVASVSWPPEIARVLKHYAPVVDVRPEDASPTADRPPEPRELDATVPLGPGTVVLMGSADEYRASQERLRERGARCRRVGSLTELRDAFTQDAVAGIVVGSSWWALDDPAGATPRRRLELLLQLSNLAWIKLVVDPAWADARDALFEICTGVYGSVPPRNRLALEPQATVTRLETRGLAGAMLDIGYAERAVDYAFAPTVAQDRIIRAATSRYLRDKFPTVHAQRARLRVRSLANRGEYGLVGLVSVEHTDVSFVIKVSPYADARQEARRFRMVAHGTSFEMEFFCHAPLGALVFAPIETRLGHARSLDDLLGAHDLWAAAEDGPLVPHAAAIDAAIDALARFSQQVRPDDVATFCEVELEGTRGLVRALDPLVVAGARVDLRWLYLEGIEVLDRCTRDAIAHGDAHPGNILFSRTGAAILIDFECTGLAPACVDPCTLWIHALGSRFVAVGDEADYVELFRQLLSGVPFESLARAHAHVLRVSVNYELVYLASRALASSVTAMRERGRAPRDIHGIVAVLLCRELLNPTLQQLVIRCALAAIWALLNPGADAAGPPAAAPARGPRTTRAGPG